jgi:CRP/FNR family transcriptional regulator
LRQLDLCRERNLALAAKGSYERVATFLLTMICQTSATGKIANGESAYLRLPLSRDEMADYLGLALETVSRQMSLLRERQVIELPSLRQVMVPDLERLTEAAKVDAWFLPTADPGQRRP